MTRDPMALREEDNLEHIVQDMASPSCNVERIFGT